MEVVIPSPSHNFDFDFNSARSSPHVSPPSTPKPFGEYYFSAPTSPSHLSQFYRDFDEFSVAGNGSRRGGSSSPVPFGDDFAFDVISEDWESASLSADELFDGGVIKPLKPPPPRLHLPAAARVSEHVMLEKPATVSASPISQTRKIIQGAFSPRRKSSKEREALLGKNATRAAAGSQRGRERGGDLPKSSSRRAARSLSPLRDVQYPWEEEKEQAHNAKSSSQSTLCSALSTAPAKGGGHKKWRLKDFFLFRSASEGRAADKDPLKKYTAAFRHSSFRSVDSPGSGSGSRRRGPVSAHELHYTMNRAVSEDLKKKTFLPYKQGILGRLAFNPAVHALANGFGFSRK
ncbi:hypothetical protein Salat_1204500 [Sesamum alatum]|uniref:Calmodulin-binding protein n=1 Tax=Sesamum alatum TaxID=300844 RepID=A0AAE1YF68_9LAMI|nr:hypothetical protein Salat_1204500 [Sesamum alatum]